MKPFERFLINTEVSIRPENLPRDRLLIMDGGYNGDKKQVSLTIINSIESMSKPFSMVITNITPVPLTVKRDSVLMIVTERDQFITDSASL
jgi:hypothetical protein